MIERIKNFLRQEEGLTIVEYAVAAGMITLLVVGAFQGLGTAVLNVINLIAGFITP
jgi:pilus assembly protein Flp/PilA